MSQHVEVIGLAAASAGTFASQVLEWREFFSSVAQVSGGLVGLIFVALTFNGRLGSQGDAALRDLARQTFADFLSILVLSLVFLVPHTLPANIALFTILLGALNALRILRALIRIRRGTAAGKAGWTLLQRFLLSMIGNAGLVLAGILLSKFPDGGPAFWSTIFASFVGLLLSGARSAWLLVVPDADAPRS